MKPTVQDALERIQQAIDSDAVRRLSQVDYRELLEEAQADIEVRLSALADEMAEDE